jgi:glycosyltransferase involved in cell wall biosynthesis
VSVLIGAYDNAATLREAMDSILAQTVEDLELIVVDDGSSDRTVEIAEAAAARDPRVRVVRQANGGVSRARNAALRLARGRYFALLDSDDVWAPRFLQAQVEILDARPEIAIVTGNAVFLGGARHGQPVRPCPDARPDPTPSSIVADETSVFIMCVFRRAVYDAIGGFDETKRTNEDYDYWLRAATAGFRFLRNDAPLAQYRSHGASLSANESRMLRGILVVLREHRRRVSAASEDSAVLERQIARFESELHASDARAALETGDYLSAARHLDALGAGRPAPVLRLARVMAHWTPGLLARLYRARRAHRARASHHGATP